MEPSPCLVLSFLPGNYELGSSTWLFKALWVDVLHVSPLSFFCMQISNSQHRILRRWHFFILSFWCLCQNLVEHLEIVLFPNSLLCSANLWYRCFGSFFHPVAGCFEFCSFVTVVSCIWNAPKIPFLEGLVPIAILFRGATPWKQLALGGMASSSVDYFIDNHNLMHCWKVVASRWGLFQ